MIDMPEIRLDHVTKIYDNKVRAVDDFSCIIEDGEYVTFIGPSGCGKTSTLRLIAGIILPTHGKIFFDNQPMHDITIQDRHVGFVFQHFAIFPHMPIWDNVAYGPRVRGKSENEVESLVEDALKRVNLTNRAENFSKDLSAPELQKAALARVLASQSKILLLDEPIGALDQKVREEFQNFLRDLVKKEGLTAIHVTHDQAEALSISDRVIVMNKGKLIQIGTPEDLVYYPTHVFSSFFVGESDFITGVVLDDSKRFAKIRVGLSTIQAHNAGIEKGRRILIAIRREFFDVKKISNQQTNLEDSNNSIQGTILSDRFLGLYRRIQVKLENQQIIEAKIHSKNPLQFSIGEKINVKINPYYTRCYHFPEEGLQSALEM